KNPYLAFLDADDIWDTNFLASVRQMIEVYPNAGIYGTNNLFVYPDGTMIKNEVCNLFKGKEFGILEDYFKIFSDLQRSPFSNSNFCIP
ncbi:glycosyltransferase family A protein, partial [Escherichia coli]